MGYLPEALRNYLLRLGWSHGDDEIISRDQAIAWFDLDAVGKSAARFDFAKLDNLNGHYIREADPADLTARVAPLLEQKVGPLSDVARDRLLAGMPGLQPRAKRLTDLVDGAAFYARSRPLAPDEKAASLLTDDARTALGALASRLESLPGWTAAAIEAEVRAEADSRGLKLGKLAQPLRAALTGTAVSPPIFEVAEILGREEALGRLADSQESP